MTFRPDFRVLGVLACAAFIAGCSQPLSPARAVSAGNGVTGSLHGGQEPVVGATIQLYTVGTAGDGSKSRPLLTSAVTTDATGDFDLSGLYTCANATELYVVATGGATTQGVKNGNLALMTALGPCASLKPAMHVEINELTTVAAANALAAYMTTYSAVGSASGDAAGLQAAFTLAGEYVDTSTGTAPGVAVPNGDIDPVDEIDSLGNMIAPCVTSGGGTAGQDNQCGTLFRLTTVPGMPAPTNTIAALLSVARNPAFNAAALFELGKASPVFQPALDAPPSSFAVAFTPSSILGPLEGSVGSLTFPATPTGSVSAAQSIVLTNAGKGAVGILGINVVGSDSADFSAANGCPDGLQGGQSCTISVTFVPQAAGARTAILDVNGQMVKISLSGTGQAGAPAKLILNPSSITFAATPLGGRTAAQSAALANAGTTPAAITSIGISEARGTDFSQTNNCPASLPAGAVCLIETTFAPQTASARTATLSVNSGALSVGLSGTGVASGNGPTSLSASSLIFFEPNLPQTVTLTNTGTATVGISSISVSSPDYSEFDNCGSALSGQSVCTIAVSAGPGIGDFTGTLTVVDSASTASVTLNTYRTYSQIFDFGNQLVDQFEPTYWNFLGEGTFTMYDDGYNFYGWAFNYQGADLADFEGVGVNEFGGNGPGCDVKLSSGGPDPGGMQPCDFLLPFSPMATGYREVVATPGPIPGTVYLFKGFGGVAGYGSYLSPAALSTGTVPLGSSRDTYMYLVDASLNYYATYQSGTFTGVNAGDFSVSLPGGNCVANVQSTLSPDLGSCQIDITFTPTALGVRTATFTVIADGQTESILVQGIGGYPVPTLTATNSFGNVVVGGTGTAQIVTAAIPGLHAAGAQGTGSGFEVVGSTQCAVGATTCSFSVNFSPTALGAATGSLVVTDLVTGANASTPLSGVGIAPGEPVVSLSPSSLTFIPRNVGETSIAQTVTLTNTGNAALSISAISLTGTNPSDYAETNTCSTSIAPGGSCSISVTNTPTLVGASSANVSIVSNATSSPNLIPLSGTGQ